ncbi:MAG: hypothetical protein JXJ04_18210 [Spirochaetales bacterium]|nr:hypothetical protein [Spirochaetales bacterium]
MNKEYQSNYNVTLDFEAVKLPPVTDILILAKKYPQGIQGVSQAFKLIAPDEFEFIEFKEDQYDVIEAILINKKILCKLPAHKILSILEEHVFPNITKGEAINVNFKLNISVSNIKGELNG